MKHNDDDVDDEDEGNTTTPFLKIPLCLVGVYHSNLVFMEERLDLYTPLHQTNKQTLTTSK